ncbi:hypothetical protein M422DRAFT_153861 [Sphaerobolus stellatus SS14]|nr:hypothetical protein M422DRAFT_153861 [Sphaerobolus stellatus SS14]
MDTPPASETPTQLFSSRSTSPQEPEDAEDSAVKLETAVSTQKKKKKKKSKKSKAKEEKIETVQPEIEKPPVLCISRNKHWRYISSYHGPWLQLPLELLESLLTLNMDPNTFSVPEHHRHPHQHQFALPPMPPASPALAALTFAKQQHRGGIPFMEISPPDSPSPSNFPLSNVLHPPPGDLEGKPPPPPIDPGVFKSVTTIRRLIDEASDLAVRAASGLSAAALGGMRSSGGSTYGYSSPWATAQSLGINPLGDHGGNGRNTSMSAMRVHRLRVLAVQKLAEAYKMDEIAASVMVMQGASALDDIAERVLKVDSNDPDARYVHFFHEKIPSRQLAESTTTAVLDELIAAYPQRLEFYRTRGIVRCFRDEYQLAVRDFTHALKETRSIRKARHAHMLAVDPDSSKIKTKKGKKIKTRGQAPPEGTSVEGETEGDKGDTTPAVHPSVLPDAPEPIEHQVLFLRAAAYLQHVVYLIENAVLELEGVDRTPPPDGTELRLCYIDNGKYGGVEIGNPDGPLGPSSGVKAQAYRQVLNEPQFREQITTLLKKSIRDHEKFLTHFDSLESSIPLLTGDLAQRTKTAFLLTESLRPGSQSQPPPLNAPPIFTTYHPLLVESHFSILLATLLLGDFVNLLPVFGRAATLVDGLEGYPVFLPARSMAQAEFIEALERLAAGWKTGLRPHSYSPERLTVLSRRSLHNVNNPDFSASFDERSTPIGKGSNGKSTPALPAPLEEQLDCARILLAPVAQRQRERAERTTGNRTSGADKKKHVPINIPLHGPRVEIVLAWLAAAHLPELESVA